MGTKKNGKRRKYISDIEVVSCPLAIRLTKESAWDKIGGDLGPFYIARLNFITRKSPTQEFGYGDSAGYFKAPTGANLTAGKKTSCEYVRVDEVSLFQEEITSSDITTSLKAELGDSILGLTGANIAAGIERHLATSFNESRTINSSETLRFAEERSVDIGIIGGNESAVCAVPYQRWKMSVCLSHVDWLQVEYCKEKAGLRVRRVKRPNLIESHSSHSNIEISGQIVGNYYYWVPIGEADTTIVTASEYQRDRINPRNVQFKPSESKKSQVYDLRRFRKTPSLYKIANAAFPLKYSQKEQAWTDERLLALLDSEPVETAWIWRVRSRIRRTRRDYWDDA